MRLARDRGERCYAHAMQTIRGSIYPTGSFKEEEDSACFDLTALASWSQALDIHSNWQTDWSCACNDFQGSWGSKDLTGLERLGCKPQLGDSEGLHRSSAAWDSHLPAQHWSLIPLPAELLLDPTLFTFHWLRCVEMWGHRALVLLLAVCSLVQICACARGKGDLPSSLPSPNILLTPMHILTEVSVHFGESLHLQRINRKRSKKQLSER